jgi:sigma54-dependent transcription regulator
MLKFKIFGMRRKILAAPVDHAAVKVDADVLSGSGTLLQELAGNAATPTAPVEDEIVGLRRDLGEENTSRRVVIEAILGGADELTKLDRW